VMSCTAFFSHAVSATAHSSIAIDLNVFIADYG